MYACVPINFGGITDQSTVGKSTTSFPSNSINLLCLHSPIFAIFEIASFISKDKSGSSVNSFGDPTISFRFFNFNKAFALVLGCIHLFKVIILINTSFKSNAIFLRYSTVSSF